MKKDLLVVFLLAFVSVALLIAGVYVIATMPAISHRGISQLPTKIVMVGLLFSVATITSIWLSTAIEEADRAIVNWDDEDAYEYFSRELAEMELEKELKS